MLPLGRAGIEHDGTAGLGLGLGLASGLGLRLGLAKGVGVRVGMRALNITTGSNETNLYALSAT